MNSALIDLTWLLFLITAPALLVVRFLQPHLLPRWAVLLLAAVLGGATFYLQEFLHQSAMSDFARTSALLDRLEPEPLVGMVALGGPRLSDFMLGAVLQLVCLLLWLVPYGTIQILRGRMNRLAQSNIPSAAGRIES